ncbi:MULTISPECIES: methyltransferase [Methylobacterium]|uniref:23S rRNA (Uracil(1939)-C(5))-methyltransferase RlmD n=1 Tax=Methylobacterium jeotgali TaxID=381630 RepID=A0ABQ4SVJ2_9HYPH|nr:MULTISPECIES: methyltransferase [Methylobacterium]PIU08750.1 MAG: RNA methyltransferase [Methylobacterium sp. CG09_land_8_20_14_0_10_71_15]PIU16362.1 MAG: RNA methyltransferase [Methylobacterium sp. CG08_land_8_20_14_0_20_71_15]GBU16049.1 23S rRNA m(5)U1939 methyltransferase [Methylobacterium sp.]GJE07229.1 23S rRNA (uracil(1939)-C(5))-methyltransferase RlmD [Methylobacterium jeotgali]
MSETESLRIARLGSRGDGLAEDGTPVAYALPGERVAIRREGARGELVAVEEPSPERIAPFCPHFGDCGGCSVQHLAPEPYRAWKTGLVAQAAAQAGLGLAPEAAIDAHGPGRRRLTLHIRDGEAGLMAARSHRLVPIGHCPITVPALHGAPALARALAAPLGHGRTKPLDALVTATDAGLDVDMRGHGPVDAGTRAKLVGLAESHDLARLSLHGDVVVERRRPSVSSPGGALLPPPGGFLQATAEAERLLATLVLDALPKKPKRVADLFSGCGPFSLALARRCEVHAVEGDAAALAGLDRAVREAAGLRRVTTERRDLFRRPLLSAELDRFDAVVMDPPRAGAEAQARQLALSKVPVVVSVSCDPGTFARDAGMLLAGGYALTRLAPVDQFRHAPHVEVVGVFERPPKARRR